jgi:hypothetical protein
MIGDKSMLVSKPITSNDIVSIKISNGDELIAKFIETTDESVVVSKPMLMVLAQTQTGQPGVQMMPFFMLGGDKDGKYPINKSHVVCMILSNLEAKSGYISATSNLTIPKTGTTSSLIAE